MTTLAEKIRFDELPTGNLSNIGHSLIWSIESRDLLTKGSIFSQIFDVKDLPCRASVLFNQRSSMAHFYIRPMAPVSAPEGLAASFEIKIYTPMKEIMVGHQTINFTFKSMDEAAGTTNLLTRSNLINNPVLVIQIESQTPFSRDSPLKPLWNCPSTSDVVILTSLSDQNVEPIFVHKCIVMAAIPNIMSFVKVLKEEPQHVNPTLKDGFKLDDDKNVTGERRKDGEGGVSNVVELKQGSDCSGFTGGKAPYTVRNGSSSPIKDETACLLNGNLDSSNGKKTMPPAKVVTQYLRTNRDVWFWPPKYTRESCISIMRWIYFRMVSPDLDICNFNSFMDLLEVMNQLQHFQEHALGVAAAIRHHGDALTLIRHVEFSEGYAAKFLKAPLTAALARQCNGGTGMVVSTDGKNKRKVIELLEEDRTGVIAEVWYQKP